MDMPLHPSSMDIAFRLILTVLAGAAIGINREAGGHSAGFRTTVLVGVAAALSMILANLLLGTYGKTPELFATMDPMRLPLGILTGMGFIGGGAILKQGTLISGVTTAATLWAMTVVGLCFGGGQLLLGAAGAALILFTLIGFKWIDLRITRQQRARVVIAGAAETPSVAEVYETLHASGYRVNFLRETNAADGHPKLTIFEIRWEQPEIAGPPLTLMKLLKGKYDVQSFEIVVEGMH
ncbi:MgtC/SapB transporter [Hyphomicrobium denitrificans 1NES1]|uniref:Protein MgtC n=1 Tax=Hyphomicrobium denitrificans 1NES1 TaxID=670307 RepID=N0BBX4_9HYPH|nr:MgtC/SapB family protein [Hyphomicrobium denitrificans]AGK57630.1 MgtC/SapB transporter [Hyphomicrobium denitrificans 1NES1]